MKCKFVSFAIVAALGLVFSESARASVIPLFNQGSNFLEDDDYESFLVDVNGNGVIDVGDQFVGVFRVQNVSGTAVGAPGNPTVTSVFAVELYSKNATGSQLNFGPLSDGAGNYDAIAQWAALSVTLGLDLPILNSDGTIVVLFDHPDFGLTNEATGTLAGSIDTFDDSTPGVNLLAEFGFTAVDTDGDGTTDADEFFTTVGPAGTDVVANIPIFLGDRLIQNPNNSLNLNVTFDVDDAIVFNQHNDLFPATLGALQGTGGFVAESVQPSGDFDLSTDTDLNINLSIIPEPTSLAIFSGLLGVAAFRRLRRRKSS